MVKVRRIIGFLLCLVFLLFSGCEEEILSNASPEYIKETDFNDTMKYRDGSSHMVETEDGYYYHHMMDSTLRFIDKKTMKEIVLCGKPECTHKDEDQFSCQAYLDNMGMDGLFFYQNKLYACIAESKVSGITVDRRLYLTEISKDGSSRKKVLEITWDEDRYPGGLQMGFLHRGKFYFTLCLLDNGSNYFSIHSIDLKTKKATCIYEIRQKDIFASTVTAIGDSLYWWEEETYMQVKYYRYELSTKTLTELDGNLQGIYAGKDKVFFQQWHEDTQIPTWSYMNRDGTGFQHTEVELQGTPTTDHHYIYQFPIDGSDDNDIDVLDVETMEIVEKIDISSVKNAESVKALNENRCVCNILYPTSGEKIFLAAPFFEVIFYGEKSAIGTPDFQWYEVEKAN